ncbi:MAG: hypothetical protein ACYS99_06820 [Planctomycetota bacterium]
MPATMRRGVRASCPECGVRHYLRRLEVGRPLTCEVCRTTFVVRRASGRGGSSHRLRSRTLEDLAVGPTRLGRADFAPLIVNGLIVLILGWALAVFVLVSSAVLGAVLLA